MRIVFMGTPDFSATVFEILNAAYPVSAVITGPDKMSGRGYKTMFSPLKIKALEQKVEVLQFEKVSRDGLEAVKNIKPDIIVTAAFGQILSDAFIAIPKYGVLNVHASLLPSHRGASPIQSAILCGDEYTGVTIMRTVKKVDAGDILLQKSVSIGDDETAGELFDRLAVLGGEAIVEAVGSIERGEAVFVSQDDSKATYCKTISKEDGKIDFSHEAKYLERFTRAMSPWPSAYTRIDGKMLKVFELTQVSSDVKTECGRVVEANPKSGLFVQAGDGVVRLKSVQAEGSKRMRDIDFLNGKKIAVGTLL